MKRILTISIIVFATLYWASCGCESYVARYTFDDADIEILDQLDYNEDSTATVETEWRPCNGLALGNSIKVGVNFLYVFTPEIDHEQCQPDYIEFRDSVKSFDIKAVYPLEGIAAEASVLEAGGFTKAMKDSLLNHMNSPLYPSNGAVYITLDKKPLEEKVQFRLEVVKANNRNNYQILSEEIIWR